MTDALTLTNPSRRTVPLITFAIVALMFAPPIVLAFAEGNQPTRAIVGTLAFAAMTAWLLRVAWRAPVRMTLTPSGDVEIGRWRAGDRYGPADVRTWSFAVPSGPVTQDAPTTNALLMVALADGTRFRGEASVDEAAEVVAWFARHAPASNR